MCLIEAPTVSWFGWIGAKHAVKTGAAVLLIATALAVTGCTTESGTGPASPRPHLG